MEDASAWIHQNVAAHYGVELARGGELVKVANLEPDPRGAALLACATAGVVESGGIAVDAKYASAGTYDICDEKCHVPHAGADIQHSHSGGKSGSAEKLFGVRAQYSGLQHQAFILMNGLSEHVVGGGWAAHCVIIAYPANEPRPCQCKSASRRSRFQLIRSISRCRFACVG